MGSPVARLALDPASDAAPGDVEVRVAPILPAWESLPPAPHPGFPVRRAAFPLGNGSFTQARGFGNGPGAAACACFRDKPVDN